MEGRGKGQAQRVQQVSAFLPRPPPAAYRPTMSLEPAAKWKKIDNKEDLPELTTEKEVLIQGMENNKSKTGEEVDAGYKGPKMKDQGSFLETRH